MPLHVTVLSEAVNNVVVQTEGRRYPGLVVQGDRLKNRHNLVMSGSPESIELLADELAQAVAWYDRVSAEHGLQMPY